MLAMEVEQEGGMAMWTRAQSRELARFHGPDPMGWEWLHWIIKGVRQLGSQPLGPNMQLLHESLKKEMS